MKNWNAFIWLFIFMCMAWSCKTQTGETEHGGDHKYVNALVNESSPYLLQHAYNPVNWYPWGEEALNKAAKEEKLILISIGYSACHWCHVMEHESFEDTTVARIMNENFVNIKVDREERPDIDDVYMTACHLSGGGSCGWPLNAIALPDGRPFFAGTYFPKSNWMKVLDDIIGLYENKPERLIKYAENLTGGITQNSLIQFREEQEAFTAEGLDQISEIFTKSIDMKKGGRKVVPDQNPNKFPMPNNYQFLLRYHHLTGNEKALKAVKVTLDNMAYGGIYDQIGGGFARYSTDPDWFAPHFEKMLYDNGQIVSLYSEAFQLTKDPMYEQIVRETLGFIKRELTSPEGGFYSSLDADSEGEEGKFYVWTMEEIRETLGDDADIFAAYYNVKEKGNWEHTNILHRKKSDEDVAKETGLSVEKLSELINTGKTKLMAKRDERIRPGLDDKVLTSWNALMLKGYCDAYRVFGDADYLETAIKNGEFLLRNAVKKGNRLNRNFKDGKSVINAFLDDYALLIDAFTELYQCTFDEKWLEKAGDLMEYTLSNFYDEESRMFFYTSSKDDPLIARKMELSDNVIPASNSVMARNLHVLGLYFYNDDYLEKSRMMLNNMTNNIISSQQPTFYSNWCTLYLEMVKEPYEVAIVGDDYQDKRMEWDKEFNPVVLLMGGKDEGSLELLKGKLVEGQTTIYVCKNKVCKLPVTEVDRAIALMTK